MSTSTLHLYSDRGCPFAHRVLALLDHLRLSFERHESRLGEKPEGLARYSASGRIPLLVHGDLVLTESRVMLEYVAERFGLAGASLLAFHVAPIWMRYRWWMPASLVVRAVEARTTLARWLDAAVALDAVASTSPDRAADAAEMERARSAGILPPLLEDLATTDVHACELRRS